MRWRVIIRPNAEADLREAQSWYNLRRPSLGDELLEEIKRTVGYLSERPEKRPIYYNGFRRVITLRFPYKVFYRLENDHVIVFRILHAKQDHRRYL